MTRRFTASTHVVGPEFENQVDRLVRSSLAVAAALRETIHAPFERFAATHVPSRYAELLR